MKNLRVNGFTEPEVIGLLGPENTYSHQAGLKLAQGYEKRPQLHIYPPDFQLLFRGLNSREISHAIIPFENSTTGHVHLTWPEFHTQENWWLHNIARLHIPHMLGAQSSDFTHIAFQAAARAQCEEVLKSERYRDLVIIPAGSTAASVEMALQDKNVAAVASPKAITRAGDRFKYFDPRMASLNNSTFFALVENPQKHIEPSVILRCHSVSAKPTTTTGLLRVITSARETIAMKVMNYRRIDAYALNNFTFGIAGEISKDTLETINKIAGSRAHIEVQEAA